MRPYIRFMLSIFTLVAVTLTTAQADIIYVQRGASSNSASCGTLASPCSTLKVAYDRIPVDATNHVTEAWQLVLLPSTLSDSVFIGNGTAYGTLNWSKSGTSEFPISLSSAANEFISLVPIGYLNGVYPGYKIKFQDVSNIHISNIKFLDSTYGLAFFNCDDCRIEYCEFAGDITEMEKGGGGMIFAAGNEDYFPGDPDHIKATTADWDNSTNISKSSQNITIQHNKFRLGANNVTTSNKNQFHAIYMSQGNVNHTIAYNTFLKTSENIGYAVHLQHSFQKNIQIVNNTLGTPTTFAANSSKGAFAVTNQWNDTSPNSDFSECGGYKDQPDGYDENDSSTWITSIQSTCVERSEAAATTNNNIIAGNWLETQLTPGGGGVINLNPDLTGNNPSIATNLDNDFWMVNSGAASRVYDAYYLNYDPATISKNVVSGDFDGDDVTDVAAWSTANDDCPSLHVWRPKKSNENIVYSGSTGWWQSCGFTASSGVGRVVTGNFDWHSSLDKKEDVAVLYKLPNCPDGSAHASLWVFLSTGSSFTASEWWNSCGFNADAVTGRVVAGDFDGDGDDDISVIYRLSATQARIYTWASTGNGFAYLGPSSRRTFNGIDVDSCQYSVKSGEYNWQIDHRTDIFGICDHNSAAKAFVWRANKITTGNPILFDDTITLSENILSGLTATSIQGNVVLGNFDGYAVSQDKNSDWVIARPSPSNPMTTDFYLLGSSSGYNTSLIETVAGYDANKIKYRMVPINSGPNDTTYHQSFLAFYDYTNHQVRTRTHLFSFDWNNGLTQLHNSFGVPWR